MVLGIEELALLFLQLYSQHFHFVGKAFNFYCLEDHNELDVVAQVDFLVVGEVLDAGFAEIIPIGHGIRDEGGGDEGAVGGPSRIVEYVGAPHVGLADCRSIHLKKYLN